MFKSNGEKALMAVCLITIIFIGMVFITGIGKDSAADGAIEPAIQKYFERMPDDQYRMSVEELQPLLEANGNLFILDIRNASDYAKDHIPGAVNIPFAQLGRNYQQIPKDKLVVLYCYTGQNGGQAVTALSLLGYQAKSLSGGWGGWTSAVSPAGESSAAVECPT